MTRRLTLFVVVISFINIINGNFPLPAITPDVCNTTDFYDSICVRCKRCGKDETQASFQHGAPDGSYPLFPKNFEVALLQKYR